MLVFFRNIILDYFRARAIYLEQDFKSGDYLVVIKAKTSILFVEEKWKLKHLHWEYKMLFLT